MTGGSVVHNSKEHMQRRLSPGHSCGRNPAKVMQKCRMSCLLTFLLQKVLFRRNDRILFTRTCYAPAMPQHLTATCFFCLGITVLIEHWLLFDLAGGSTGSVAVDTLCLFCSIDSAYKKTILTWFPCRHTTSCVLGRARLPVPSLFGAQARHELER